MVLLVGQFVRALEPLVDLVQAVSYLVCYTVISGGCFLLVAASHRSRGLALIRWGTVGFLGLQFTPALLQFLHMLARAIHPRL